MYIIFCFKIVSLSLESRQTSTTNQGNQVFQQPAESECTVAVNYIQNEKSSAYSNSLQVWFNKL